MKGEKKAKVKKAKAKKPKIKKERGRKGPALAAKLMNTKFWRKLKLGQKYGAALFITIGLFAVSTIITFVLLTMVNVKMNTVEETGDKTIQTTEIAALFNNKGSTIGNFIIDSNPKHLANFKDLEESMDKLKKQVQPSLRNDETKSLYKRIDQNDKQITKIFNDVIIPEVKLQNVRGYRLGKLQVDNIITETVGQLDELRSILKEDQKRAVASAKAGTILTMIVLAVSVVVSSVLGVASILLIGRLISGKLSQIVTLSNEVAAGNLNIESVEMEGEDELAELSRASNSMKEKLQAMIQEISAVSTYVTDRSGELNISANEVRSASQQAASTMQELSGGAEEQANSATSLAEMMEDYLAKVEYANQSGAAIRKDSGEVLNMTKNGDELMKESQQQMLRINEIMKSSVQKVQGLDEQTKQISKLVQVIHDIANQTNLLALNAAIEAARAGEHGRGFAVVADEVRKLAEQVSFSVSDITKIVKGIQAESNDVVLSLQHGYEQVEEGTGQIEHTGQTFQNIYQSVNRMSENINEISRSLEQISSSSAVMNDSIENIASVSEESAAGIEQTSASISQTNNSMEEISDNAQSLSELADQLNEMISKFRL